MIPVSRSVLSKEPDGFDAQCRKKGSDWLARNPKASRQRKQRPRKAKIPTKLHGLVNQTLENLHLVDDERIVRQRREWLRMYEDGEITFSGLKKSAPLFAAAIEKRDGSAR